MAIKVANIHRRACSSKTMATLCKTKPTVKALRRASRAGSPGWFQTPCRVWITAATRQVLPCNNSQEVREVKEVRAVQRQAGLGKHTIKPTIMLSTIKALSQICFDTCVSRQEIDAVHSRWLYTRPYGTSPSTWVRTRSAFWSVSTV